MKWKISGAVAAAASVLTATLVAAPAAHAAGPSYVALGDSYASGTGTRSYIDDGTSCQRSTYAYPSLIAAARGYSLNFRACSGARIPDVTNNQLSALTSTTKYVSISVGGNDAGFADVLTECAQPGWMSDCDGAIDGAQAYINNTLPAKLSTLYAAIRAKSPTAKVVVVGYPRIFNGEDCNALTWFSPAEESRLNATADLLNSRTATQAGAKGFSFANPTSRFVGHAVCDDPEYLNGLSNPISESYHPNKPGHASGYTPTVSPLLTGASLTVTADVRRTAAASADDLAAQQRQYAAADASITPETFGVPDLDSPRARAAARKAGIDIDRWVARQARR
ncbi:MULTISPECIES: SGNH/GDSL hydrolase family protein [unclassified Nocardioides]|uniref:SGNH/GDSL hydrolase family protein n=1 Tax=unclassified Nocardioides TaxID=2615069 RepID=UPI000701D446|nr:MULTISPECIES: SGNH/GDSL hydrolase family protein [unclassified Nocardioides]KQY57571.1 hydrolase [Nocardioides sp. Root140]KQZ76060.1 hydrolase [Nocardioides sp. Root151]KRF15133.1 hydrolase [Nocardioides sp. Soil796]